MKQLFQSMLFFLLLGYSICATPKSYQPNAITMAPQQLTINKAIKTAYRNRPTQKEYDFLIKAGEMGQLAALSGYLPQLSVQNRIGTVNRALLLPEKQVFLEAKQLLLSFSGPLDRYRIARQETNISYTRKIYDQDTIRFETEKSLLDLWDIQQKYNFISSLGISSQVIFERDKHQEQLGLLDTNIWLQAVAQYAQSTALVEQYTDKLNIVVTDVERSLGISSPTNIALNQQAINSFISDSIIAAKQHDADLYYQYALVNRKELMTLNELIIREDYVGKSYAKSYLPDVSLFGQMNYFNFKPSKRAQAITTSQGGSGITNRFVDWRVGLEFNWNFDGLGNVFNAESSNASQLALQASQIDTIQKIKKEVFTSYDVLQSSIKTLHAQQAKFKQADNEFILRKKQHEIGEISDVELTQAETSWKQSCYDLINIERQVAVYYRELLYKSGYPGNLS